MGCPPPCRRCLAGHRHRSLSHASLVAQPPRSIHPIGHSPLLQQNPQKTTKGVEKSRGIAEALLFKQRAAVHANTNPSSTQTNSSPSQLPHTYTHIHTDIPVGIYSIRLRLRFCCCCAAKFFTIFTRSCAQHLAMQVFTRSRISIISSPMYSLPVPLKGILVLTMLAKIPIFFSFLLILYRAQLQFGTGGHNQGSVASVTQHTHESRHSAHANNPHSHTQRKTYDIPTLARKERT